MKTIAAFVHIPKNAGSYVTWLLRSYFGMRHCRVVASNRVAYVERDFRVDQRVYPDLRCISGHDLHPYVDLGRVDSILTWATVLRDPYERFPSHYRWWCKKRNVRLGFEEWCEKKGQKFANYQCRWLAGEPDASRAIDVIRERSMLVGDQRQLTTFLRAWIEREGWQDFPLVDEVVNATQTRNDANRDLIEKYNEADIELFQRCQSEGLFARPTTNELGAASTPSKSGYYLNLCKHVTVYKPYRRLRDIGSREAAADRTGRAP